jgi:cysteinyl-tRNA synthetase
MLRVYSTLTRKKEEFQPLKAGEVRIYSCGPTVYNYAHIGNLRAFVVSDLICRYLKYKGYKLTKVMNITDVDDKTIAGALKEGVSLKQFTDKYTRAFLEDINTLGIEPASVYPKATEHIKEIVELIKRIIKKGHTYEQDGSIYFKISSFPEYGRLAHLDFQKLIENAQGRLDSDSYDKESARDFVLWKAWKPADGDVFWDTELGRGRPGWHIECSAMAMKYLGESFDMHTGGIDLVFPHHTNEIAQSESVTGKQFVKYWLHNEYLFVEGEKMSKSLGNFFTLRDLLEKGLSPMAVRYTLLSTHFRMPLNFTIEGVKGSQAAIGRLNNFVSELQEAKHGEANPKITKLIEKAEKGFEDAMDDNINISKALAVVFDFIKDVYKQGFTKGDSKGILALLKKINTVLGVISFKKADKVSERVEALIEKRNLARKNKEWKTSDAIRDELLLQGIELLDTPDGTKWREKSINKSVPLQKGT